MKKNGLVITILLVIVLLHAAVLYVCLRSPAKEQKTGTKQPESTAAAVKPQPAPAPAPVPERSISPAEYRRLRKKPSSAGQPFIYRWAVNGNIVLIPDSAQATAGILVDVTTRKVLWCKNPRKPVPIASMTKIMTVLLAYEDALSGRNQVSLDSKVQVTRAASKIGGSQVYLDPRETFTLSELMRAASIQSANDAAYLIAEFLGQGSVESFVARMNARAQVLGMHNTHFYNPHGLPDTNNNVASPEDMVRLAEATMDHPLLMEWAATLSAPFGGPRRKAPMIMRNHNHLLPKASEATPGVNGLKTGFINRSGFCVTITCTRNGHKLVAVINGVKRRIDRDKFAQKLINWGYARVYDPEAALRNDATVRTPASSKKNVRARRTKRTKR